MSTLAERQLEAWQTIARAWPVSFDAQFTDPYQRDRSYRCADCKKGVALAVDLTGRRYTYTGDQWLALIVLHLRNHHPDLDPDR